MEKIINKFIKEKLKELELKSEKIESKEKISYYNGQLEVLRELRKLTELKTFKDLKFEDHYLGKGRKHALMFFPNGYGISVVTGKSFYTNEIKPYEIAVLKGDENDWEVCYNTHITNDVVGYLDENEVTQYMLEIQKLNK
jgi:hypothetical protein